MIKYAVAKPFMGGLCYFRWHRDMFPILAGSWIPDEKLATQFDTMDEAQELASFIPDALVVELDYGDD